MFGLTRPDIKLDTDDDQMFYDEGIGSSKPYCVHCVYIDSFPVVLLPTVKLN